MNYKVIWDLDGTLIPTTVHYDMAKIRFVKFMLDQFGVYSPKVEDILNRLSKIDSMKYKERQSQPDKGLSRFRFPQSITDTFEEIANERNLEYDDDTLKQITEIGNYAFSPELWSELGMIAGALEVLDYCSSRNCMNYLMTKGDPEIQWKKIEHFELGNKFADISVVWEKTPEEFERLFGDFPRNRCYAIGDSPSDFKPCPEANGIYVPATLWKGQVDIDRQFEGIEQKVITVRNLHDIKERFDEIFD